VSGAGHLNAGLVQKEPRLELKVPDLFDDVTAPARWAKTRNIKYRNTKDVDGATGMTAQRGERSTGVYFQINKMGF
jgi:hypothetical protein